MAQTPETEAETRARLGAAMHRIADALQYMRGPDGEVIFIGEKIPSIAWHLARAGGDIIDGNAIIKRRAIPNRPGQFAGLVDWVPIDAPDPDPAAAAGAELVSATADVDIDLDALDDALPWHTKTNIEGGFTQ